MIRILSVFLALMLGFLFACGGDDGGTTGTSGGTGTTGGTGGPDNPTVNNADYLAFFDPAKIHEITVTISTAEWAAMSNDLWKSRYADGYGRTEGVFPKSIFNSEIYRKADYTTGDSTFNNIGIRVRGNTSRHFPQYGNDFYWTHFKISFSQDFAENEDVYGSPAVPTVNKSLKRRHGVRGLILKYHIDDESGVKEPFSYDLLRRFGLPAPGFTFAKLTIRVGATDRYFGLYQVYEPIDKEFIRLRWNTSAFLFKCLYSPFGPAALNSGNVDGVSYNPSLHIGIEQRDPENPTAAAGWQNEPPAWPPSARAANRPYRPPYDLKAKETEIATARNELDALIQGISTKSGSEFNSWITTVFDVDRFLRHQAVTALLGQWDDYWQNFNNYYLLKRPSDNRWVLIPYDYDHTFETSYGHIGTITTRSLLAWGRDEALLAKKILANPTWLNQYKEYIRILISPTNAYFTAAAVGARVDQLQATIGNPGAPVHNNPNPYSPAAGKTALIDFVTARVAHAESEIGGGGGGYASNYDSMYVRGVNGWNPGDAKAMSLVADNTWRAVVSGVTASEFKFEVTGTDPWGTSWGGNFPSGGTLYSSGAPNIPLALTGTVTFTFNDETLVYTVAN